MGQSFTAGSILRDCNGDRYAMISEIKPDWPDDETLVAFVDGELDADQSARVERFLESDTEAKRFVDLLRDSGKIASQAYDDALVTPVPDRLAELIMNAPAGPVRDGGPSVIQFNSRRFKSPSLLNGAWAMAACLTLIAGGAALYQTAFKSNQAYDIAVGPVASGSLIEELLERKTSGEAIEFQQPGTGQAGELIVMASFRDRQDRACREVEATHPGETGNSITVAIACRTSKGWFVEGAARMAAVPAVPTTDFSPASGDQKSVIDGILTALGAKPPLSKENEKDLIKGQWK